MASIPQDLDQAADRIEDAMARLDASFERTAKAVERLFGPAYTELDYLDFRTHYKTTTKAEQVAHFGSLVYEQMERRYDRECCEGCDEHSEELENGICYRCQCLPRFVQGGKDDPDGYNDVPRGEQE